MDQRLGDLVTLPGSCRLYSKAFLNRFAIKLFVDLDPEPLERLGPILGPHGVDLAFDGD